MEWNGSTQSVMITSSNGATKYESNASLVYPSSRNSSVPYSFITAKYPLYLYSNDQKTFLGKLVTDKYNSQSFSNSYGDYGSKYSTESVFNEYASRPPIIVDSNGRFIAYLTANEYNANGISYLELMSILREQYQ